MFVGSFGVDLELSKVEVDCCIHQAPGPLSAFLTLGTVKQDRLTRWDGSGNIGGHFLMTNDLPCPFYFYCTDYHIIDRRDSIFDCQY
eukprot:scaffold122829_cov30-Cyclotella_meneghiniana.AAC.4